MQVHATFFPTLNAFLNGSSAVLIAIGLYFIRSGRRQAHKRMMVSAFVTSCLFLISYLYYHIVRRAGVTRFRGQGIVRPIYFTILTSHTILVIVVVPSILVTLVRALKGLNLVGCDLVEVSPPFDSAEITSLLAANLLFEQLCLFCFC